MKVRHVIVCGHYRCGGVRAALEGERFGLVDNWLRSISDVHLRNSAEIDALPGVDERVRRLAELNTVSQVGHVCQTTIVQDAWRRRQRLAVHGLIYDVADGLLRDLGVCITGSVQSAGMHRLRVRSPELVLPSPGPGE